MADMINPANIERELLKKLPKHTFTIPDNQYEEGKLVYKGVRELETDPKEVSLRQLTYEEELQAIAAAEVRKTTYQYEGAMRSVVEVDGKPITWTDNAKERFFSDMSQACRELVVRGFSSIALPTVKAAQDFLASEKVSIG